MAAGPGNPRRGGLGRDRIGCRSGPPSLFFGRQRGGDGAEGSDRAGIPGMIVTRWL